MMAMLLKSTSVLLTVSIVMVGGSVTVYTTCENIDESLVLGGLNVTSEYAIRVQGVNWDGPGNSSDVLVYYPHVCGTGLPPTVELPLTGGGGSGPSSVSGGASTGNEGASSCIGGSTVQTVGGFGFSFGGSGNGDDDPYERPADYKRLGGCSSDEGMYSVPVEEQPSDSSASELVPGTDTNYVRARKVHMGAAAVKRGSGVDGLRLRALPLPFQALGMSKQQANPNPYEHSSNSYEGEEWQGQGIVRGVHSPLPPPPPPLPFPQQVTSPHEEVQNARQMVGTPSSSNLVIPPIARRRQTYTPQAELETAQLLVYPPDEVDRDAAERHGQQHILVAVESINAVPLVGMPVTQATDLVAQQLLAAGFDPDDEFVLAEVMVLYNVTIFLPLGGNTTIPSPDEHGVIVAVHVDKVYPMRNMYRRRVGY